MTYRTTPQATTGVPPCDLFLGRLIRTGLDLLKPDLAKNVNQKQAIQKPHHDRHAKTRVLDAGQRVTAQNFGEGPKWLPGIISQQQCGPVMFEVKLEDGRLWKCHSDLLKLQEQVTQVNSKVVYLPMMKWTTTVIVVFLMRNILHLLSWHRNHH